MCITINKKKSQNKEEKKTYSEQNTFINNPINIPVPRAIFFFSPSSTLAILTLK